MSEMGPADGSRRRRSWATLAGLVAIAVIAALPSSASAAPCAEGSTSWLGAGSGSFNEDANWSNGGPTSACDALITAPGTYTVTMTAGANMKSLTFGGPSGAQTLHVVGESANTNINANVGGVEMNANATIVLDCPQGGCFGGGAPRINVNPGALKNAGTIIVAPGIPAGGISGPTTNTGTMEFFSPLRFDNALLTNKGAIDIADGVTVSSGGSSCGDETVAVKNDTGGQIVTTGTGTFDITNYEQGAGSTSGTNPVQQPCGSLRYTGSGDSKVQAYGGVNLSGTVQTNQALTITGASSNTNAVLAGDFVNNGSIILTCPSGGCSGGAGAGPGFNAAGHEFINAGAFTVSAASGTGTRLSAGLTNTGTMQFDQNTAVGGVVVNEGKVGIADGRVLTSAGSSCGDTSDQFRNEDGGQIVAVGSGTLSVFNYQQGKGTTSGILPVQMPCGSLKYTGPGASVVQVNGGVSMTGGIAAGQTLRIPSTLNSPAFNNAGTIFLDQSEGGPNLNVSGTLTNTGTIAVIGPSANTTLFLGSGSIEQTGPSASFSVEGGTKLNMGSNQLLLKAGRLVGAGTLIGSVVNSGGTVAPSGNGPATLSVGGDYTQGAGGTLEVDVAGTGAGQSDMLAVGGSATLGGTLALMPSAGYASAAAVGDEVEVLVYAGARPDPFGSLTTTPLLPCPKRFSAAYDDAAKSVSAVVSDSGVSCGGGGGSGGGGGGGGGANPPPASPPNTLLGAHPKGKITTKKSKVSVKFAFSSDLAGAAFECKLDKGSYASCKSPKSYKVKPGKHKFLVRALSSAGVADPTPAQFSFKVVKKKS